MKAPKNAAANARATAVIAIQRELDRLNTGGIGAQDIIMAMLNGAADQLAIHAAEGGEQATIDAACIALRRLFWESAKSDTTKAARLVAGLMTAKAARQKAEEAA